jgi:hypothetical protein
MNLAFPLFTLHVSPFTSLLNGFGRLPAGRLADLERRAVARPECFSGGTDPLRIGIQPAAPDNILPFGDVLAGFFAVSVGMLLALRSLLSGPGTVLLLLIINCAIKVATATFAALALRCVAAAA